MEITTTTAIYLYEYEDYSADVFFWSKYGDDDYEDEKLKIVLLVIYSLVCVLGVLGNSVVIWVTGFKMKKNVNTIWYLNLAVADFLVTVFLPLEITSTALDNHWPFGKFMCKMERTVFLMNMYASIFTLMVISVDRCVCVVSPVWAQNHRNVRKASCVSLGVWVLGLALSSPYLVFGDTAPSVHDEDIHIILCYNNFTLTVDVVMTITRFLMGFLVPFTVIVSCYSVIIYQLRNKRSMAGQSGRRLKIIATVITAFFLCWAPYHIMFLIYFVNHLMAEYSDTLQRGRRIASCLALLNSCLNPLLYVFMCQDFRDVFRSSILKVLEKAFTEELPQTNTSTNPGRTRQEIPLSQTQV